MCRYVAVRVVLWADADVAVSPVVFVVFVGALPFHQSYGHASGD